MRLHDLRRAANFSQRDLAKAINSPHSSVAQWETGKQQPSAAKFVAMARVLNISLEEMASALDLESDITNK